MTMRLLPILLLLFCAVAQGATFTVPRTERDNIARHPSWTSPQVPVRIYGNTWYVGPHGLTVLLIRSSTGDVLVDGGLPGYADLIEANLTKLGVPLQHIKWIVVSHAHSDHAGGVARLARDTGAQVIAGAADAPLLARGGRGDPQYGNRFPFPPVHVARTVSDGERVRLGDLTLTAHATPGHTRGNTTWSWISCQGTRCLHLVDIGSLSAPDYRLVGNPAYPDIVRDYRHSFAMVATLHCDIALNPHPGAVDFWARIARRRHGDADALINPGLCRTYAQHARKAFEATWAKQRAGRSAAGRSPGVR